MSLINALSQPPPQWSLSRDATDAPPRSGGRRAPHRAKADGRSATADRSRAARQRCARARRTTVSRARDRVDQRQRGELLVPIREVHRAKETGVRLRLCNVAFAQLSRQYSRHCGRGDRSPGQQFGARPRPAGSSPGRLRARSISRRPWSPTPEWCSSSSSPGLSRSRAPAWGLRRRARRSHARCHSRGRSAFPSGSMISATPCGPTAATQRSISPTTARPGSLSGRTSSRSASRPCAST